MSGKSGGSHVIHQSLVRPVLLAGAERPLAIANWITAAALILGGGAVVHGRSGRVSRDGRPLGAGAGGEDRSGTEPGLHPPHSLSQDRYPARASIWARRRARSADRAAAARNARLAMRGGEMFFKEFRDLRRKADRRLGLPDLLNYGFAERRYTIVMKDGARLAAFECSGPRSELGQSPRSWMRTARWPTAPRAAR